LRAGVGLEASRGLLGIGHSGLLSANSHGTEVLMADAQNL